MGINNLQNWNQLEYAKYHFWQESIHIKDKEVYIAVDLYMDYTDREEVKFKINSKIKIINHGHIRVSESRETNLKNLFRLKKVSEIHLYILPYEEELIKKALDYAKEKITQFTDCDGENL